mmetsp:Transcript_24137/g.21953  ORF Transcript_24137/g.21953 Transcript_24137/m.21953 type:complete len:274 (+) Transcript_24137:32-853(+)
MSLSADSDRLIANFTDLYDNNEEIQYATAKEAFLDQSIFKFVMDEVHAIAQILFCESPYIATFWNPIYLVIYIVLYILTLPGALTHWLLLDIIPVRKIEIPEERELRAQGIYTALGLALISLPFAIVGLYIGDNVMLLINKVSLAVNSGIIAISLIGLKVIAEEMILSVRVYIVGSWVIVLFLIGLALVNVYTYLTFSWISIVEYSLRLLEIFIYAIIGFQSLQFWNFYRPKEKFAKDLHYAIILAILYSGVIVGFITAIVISSQNAWKILSW